MQITPLKDRFEFYATNLKEIGHNPLQIKEKAFFHVDLEEIQQALSEGIKFPSLYLQTPEVEKSGVYDNMSEIFDFTFVVMMKGTADKTALFDQAKLISDKIINRLMYDVAIDLLPGVISGTNEGKFGPVGDGLYGWAVSCSVSDGYNAEINPNDWEDLA